MSFLQRGLLLRDEGGSSHIQREQLLLFNQREPVGVVGGTDQEAYTLEEYTLYISRLAGEHLRIPLEELQYAAGETTSPTRPGPE